MSTKKVDTWMPLLVDKYLGDTTHLNTEQHGAYLLLLLTCWKRGGELPDDDGQLQAITRLRPARWKVHAKILRMFFDAEDGMLRQKRLTAELARAQANLGQRSMAGKASAAARKVQREGNERSTDVATNAQREPQRNVKPIPTPSSPSTKKKNAPSAWVCPDWVPAAEWQHFVEHRRAMRGVPFTDAARDGVVRELAKFLAIGHDPAVLLQTAVTRGWRTVFEPKPHERPVTNGETPWQRSQRERVEEMAPGVARKAPGPQTPAKEIVDVAARLVG